MRGDLVVNDNELNGKVNGFGFPASNEISPGVFSNGRRLRTVQTIVRSVFHSFCKRQTWAGFPFFSKIGKKVGVVC